MLAVANRTAVNIGVPVSFGICVFIFFGYSKSIFSILINIHVDFQRGWTIFYSHQQCLMPLPAFVSGLYLSHSFGYEGASWWLLDLHFSSDKWLWVVFICFLIIGRLFVFLGEVGQVYIFFGSVSSNLLPTFCWGLFDFFPLLLCCMSFFCVLEISFMLDIWHASIFSVSRIWKLREFKILSLTENAVGKLSLGRGLNLWTWSETGPFFQGSCGQRPLWSASKGSFKIGKDHDCGGKSGQ